jgi:hypothetical protein
MSSIRSTSTPSTAQPARQGQTTTQQQQTSQTTTAAAAKPACERVAMRAYEKWLQRGCVHGYDQQDWVEAEREVMAEQNRSTTSSAGSQPPSKQQRR